MSAHIDVTLGWFEWSANEQISKVSVICKKNTVSYETLGKNYWLSTSTSIHASYFKMVSLFNVILF